MNEVKKTLNDLVSAVKLGDSSKARDCLEALVSNKPKLNASWLGVAQMAILSAEVSLAKQALEMFQPNGKDPIPETLQQLAMLIETGQIIVAFNKAKKLAKTNPTRPEINHFLSTVALQLNKRELAINYAEEVLKSWPTAGQTWLILVSCEKILPDSSLIERMLNIKNAVTETRNQASKSSFFAALSKVYFDINDFDQAFSYASQANAFLNEIQTYSGADDSQNVRYIESQCAKFEVGSEHEIKADAKNPIFIVGLPRTGTSLLEQMLCSHSDVIDGGEFSGMERASKCLTKGLPIGSRADHLDNQLIEKHLLEIRRKYLQYAHERYGKSGVVVDKSMTNNRYLWLIKKVFPNSPIIFIKRNILDTAWSCYRTHFSNGFTWSTNLENTAEYFSLEESLNRLYQQKYLSSILVVSYQDLVEQPNTLLKELCHFCGLKYENEMLSFYKNKRPVYTASVAQVRQALHQESVGSSQEVKRQLQPFIDHYKFSIEN